MFANYVFNSLIRTKLILIGQPAIKYHLSCVALAGHSKWANIRHIKAAKDGQKSTLFTKLARQIRLAVQDGGSANPEINSALRNAIDDALKRNMPNTKIQTILKKYTSPEMQQQKLRKHILELKAPNNIFLICVLYSENITQTRQTIAPILRKNLVTSLADIRHLFIEKGLIETVPYSDQLKSEFSMKQTQTDLEEICTEHAINCGAEDLEVINFQTKTISFVGEPRDLEKMRTKLTTIGYGIEHAEHLFIPKTPIQLNASDLQVYRTFKDKLQAVDGVDEIFDNVDE